MYRDLDDLQHSKKKKKKKDKLEYTICQVENGVV